MVVRACVQASEVKAGTACKSKYANDCVLFCVFFALCREIFWLLLWLPLAYNSAARCTGQWSTTTRIWRGQRSSSIFPFLLSVYLPLRIKHEYSSRRTIPAGTGAYCVCRLFFPRAFFLLLLCLWTCEPHVSFRAIKCAINQSINQPFNHSLDHSINYSILVQ